MFTANPEDYTNRGSIITPLKDRIESQILTHYPKTIEIARSITQQEAKLTAEQRAQVYVPDLLQILLEQIAFEARDSEFVDSKSGVSARLTISGYENLVSTAERRLLINRENKTVARLTDFWGVVPAITGKVELVYEGEQEGPYLVAINLLGKSLKKLFLDHFPDPDKLRKGRDRDPYGVMRAWFSGGNAVNLLNDMSDKDYRAALDGVAGLRKFVEANLEQVQGDELYLYMELVLHGLAEFQVISKDMLEAKLSFRDTLADMLNTDDLFDEDDE
jgi:magnesium chelatase subunit I